MAESPQQRQRGWTAAGYAILVVGLSLLATLGGWGLLANLRATERLVTEAAFRQLRSQAERRAEHVRAALDAGRAAPAPPAWAADSLSGPWLARFWKGVGDQSTRQLYAALVDPQGRIAYHSDAAFIGRTLDDRFPGAADNPNGNDVLQIEADVLDSGRAAYDVGVPVSVNGQLVATYHEGVDRDWLDGMVSAERERVWRRWMTLAAIGVLVCVAFTLGVRSIVLHVNRLRQQTRFAKLERDAQIGALAAGLAHEVRNPLHAVRLNLNTLAALSSGEKPEGGPADGGGFDSVEAVIDSTDNAIARIERLIQELIDYARPRRDEPQTVDVARLAAEISELFRHEVAEIGAAIRLDLPGEAATVSFNEDRLRQVLTNLLLNARDAVSDVGGAGRIVIRVARSDQRVVVNVDDNGPGVPAEDVPRLFDPFFTTKEQGAGFGLALTRRYVEQGGGEVRYEPLQPGARFSLELPRGPK